MNEDDLDLSNIDKLQTKVLKEMSSELKDLKDKKAIKYIIVYHL